MSDKSEKTKLNKYYWNGNAATHQAAVFRFAVWGGTMGGVVSLPAGVMLMKVISQPTREIVFAGTVAVVFCWLVVWLVTFLACNFAYYALIESQVKKDTPPPTKIKREIFYVGEKEAKIVYRDE